MRAKIISGKIIPVLAGTSSCIAGFATLQLYSLVNDPENFSRIRNAFINLAICVIITSEPFSKKVHVDKILFNNVFTKAIPSGWNCWDKIDVQGPLTLSKFTEKMLLEYKINISAIMFYEFNKKLSNFSNEQL